MDDLEQYLIHKHLPELNKRCDVDKVYDGELVYHRVKRDYFEAPKSLYRFSTGAQYPKKVFMREVLSIFPHSVEISSYDSLTSKGHKADLYGNTLVTKIWEKSDRFLCCVFYVYEWRDMVKVVTNLPTEQEPCNFKVSQGNGNPQKMLIADFRSKTEVEILEWFSDNKPSLVI